MSIETPIGLAGTGRMGAAIARRLLGLGHPLVVWNRDRARAEPLAALGAEIAATPAELAARCPVVLSMLIDAGAVEAVYRGPGGLLSGPVAGKLFVDLSTIGPAAARALGAAVEGAGADFVECPVGGTVGPAAEGKLLGLAGGSGAALARARPLLDLICRRVVEAGPVGAGATLKLSVNLPLLVYWQALGEALGLMARQGLTPEELVEVLGDTSGAPAAMKMRGPQIGTALGQGTEIPVAFELKGALKDLGLMVEAGQSAGVEMPVTAAARDAYARTVAEGNGGLDATAQATVAWRGARG